MKLAYSRQGPVTHTGPRPPLPLFALAAMTAGASVLPLVYLLIRVSEGGPAAWRFVWRPQTLTALMNTAGLALAVTVSAIVIGVPLAWLTTRTDLPGRHLWTVLTSLPLVVPSYVGSFALIAAFGPRGSVQQWLQRVAGIERIPEIYGFFGAWLVLTLFSYPFVLLSVRGAMQRLSPGVEESARSLGLRPAAVFFRVTLPLLRSSIAAGGLLVALYTVSDFGAVTMLQYNALTRAIYLQYEASLNRAGAAAYALVLVALTLLILSVERASARRSWHASGVTGTGRQPQPVPLGKWRWPAFLFCGLIVVVALVIPLGVVIHWLVRGLQAGEPLRLVWTHAVNSVAVSASAAIAAVLLALPVALLAVRYAGRTSQAISRLLYVSHALPGLVVALSLVFFAIRLLPGLYQTYTLMAIAYVLLFLPQALGAVQGSLQQVNPRLEEAARSLGLRPLAAFAKVTAPLLLPGMLSGAALVFLTSMKELPASLLLSPIGVRTLATSIWDATAEGFFARAAAPMLLLIVLSSSSLGLVLRQHEQQAGKGANT